MVGLPDDEKTLRISNGLNSIPACDRRTDRHSDGGTSCHGIVRAMHTRRAVKLLSHSRSFKIFEFHR